MSVEFRVVLVGGGPRQILGTFAGPTPAFNLRDDLLSRGFAPRAIQVVKRTTNVVEEVLA